jgi:dTDP-3-amino-3,4,6-trideoxy-alpha-D-glucose transaminase
VIRSKERDSLAQALAAASVQTLIHYPVPPHLSDAYSDLGFKKGSFPIAEELASSVLSLPMGPHLTDGQQDQIITAIRSWASGHH